jgi:hypothetical protein
MRASRRRMFRTSGYAQCGDLDRPKTCFSCSDRVPPDISKTATGYHCEGSAVDIKRCGGRRDRAR